MPAISGARDVVILKKIKVMTYKLSDAITVWY